MAAISDQAIHDIIHNINEEVGETAVTIVLDLRDVFKVIKDSFNNRSVKQQDEIGQSIH